MVGDIINVIIPSNKQMGVAEGRDSLDRVLSGRYLITELHHLVIPSSQMHSMTMTVMKDSFETAPMVTETKYKPEPMGNSDVGLKKRSLIH